MNDDWRWNDDLALPPAQESTTPVRVSHRGFDGEKFPGGWSAFEESFIDAALDLDYFTLRARSHKIFETNLYARAMIRRLVTNEVHTGLALEADPTGLILGISESELETWTDKTEAHFGAWADTPAACDHEQRLEMTLGEQTSTARREALVGGDVLVVLRQNAETQLPTIQLIPGQRVQTPWPAPAGVRIVDGVELDDSVKVAYHVQDPVTGEFTRIPAMGPRSGRRVAWLMYGTDRRSGQVRGTPLLAIMLQSLREIDRYRDSTQRKAVINSILTMWIEKKEDKVGSLPLTGGAVRAGEVATTDIDGTARVLGIADQHPGLVAEELQQGEVPHSFNSNTGDTVQFPEFEAAIVSAIAMACEMPPEIYRLSFDKNYSASAAGLNEFKIYLSVARRRIALAFNQPAYEAWLVAAVDKGTIVAAGLAEAAMDLAQFEKYAAWVHTDWIGAVKPTTDILKTVRAFEVMEQKGWITNNRIARELTGTRFSTNARILRRERAELPVEPEPESQTASLELRLLALEEKANADEHVDDST